ncbi:MAG: AAA family ATPase [Candidatus Lokiarchaeota archaeon]|nr:AAA family ATPase [Candidatus Lokiarchaeota archaeon]
MSDRIKQISLWNCFRDSQSVRLKGRLRLPTKLLKEVSLRMIIESVRLKNFISHAKSEVEFPLGVSILVGPNGAGKSAVIDAILYALTGNRVRGEKVDDLIREGSREMEVGLSFRLDGIEHNIARQRKRAGNPDAKLRIDKKMVANSQMEVTSEIMERLQMDEDTIINSVFIRQGEITALLEADPAERKELIGKLIGLDRLDKAYVNMRQLISHFEDKAEKFGEVKREIEIRRESKQKRLDEINTLQKDIETLQEELKEKEKELKKAQKEVETWEKKEEKYNELSKEISVLKEKISAKENEIKSKKKSLEEAKKAHEDMKKIEPEIQIIDTLENYIDTLDIKQKAGKDLDAVEKELKKVKGLLKDKDTNRKEHELYTQKEKELTEARAKRKKLESAQSKYAEITTEIKHIKKDIESREEQISKIKSKACEFLPTASRQVQVERIKELEEKHSKIKSRVSDLQEQIGQINGRIREIKEYQNILGEEDKCPVCHKELTKDHRNTVMEEFKTELESITQEQVGKKEKIRDLEKELTDVSKELDKVKTLELNKLEDLEETLKDAQNSSKKLESEQKNLEAKVKKFEDVKTKIGKLEEKLKELKDAHTSYLAVVRSLEDERDLKIIKEEEHKLEQKINTTDKKLQELKENLKTVPESPKEKLQELRELAKQFEVLRSKSEKIGEYEKEIDRLEKDFLDLKSKHSSIEKDLKGLKYEKETHEAIQKSYATLDKEKSELLKSVELKSKSLKEQQEELNGLEDTLKELNKEFQSLKKIKGFLVYLREIRTSFSKDGIQTFMREKIAPIISNFACDYLDYFNLDITDIELNKDFDISLYGRSGEISVKSISGGEMVAVAIALRLAIARTISGKISTIIMDEPTTHLDEERRRELVKIMSNFLKEKSSLLQMIIVTHHRELEDLADTIYRVKKVDNVSQIKPIKLV